MAFSSWVLHGRDGWTGYKKTTKEFLKLGTLTL